MKRRLLRVLSFFWLLLTHPWHIPGAIWGMITAIQKHGLLGAKIFISTFTTLSGHDESWCLYKRTFFPEKEAALRQAVAALPNQPLISVLVPTYNTPPAMLNQALKSLQAQWYSHWEAIIVDDGSDHPETRATLERWAKTDSRIRVTLGERRGSIAATTNAALRQAQGEYCLLLDHDDLLEPQAMSRLVQSIAADDPDFIYSDEALVDEAVRHTINFVFRPAFSWEKLRTHPYIVHLVCVRTTLLRQIGGLDESLKISQDYDLILRVAEVSKTIVHIPEILYRWRQRESSAGHEKQAQVATTSRQILSAHLQRTGLKAEVREGLWFNFYRIDYALDKQAHKVAIIIPTKNYGKLLRQCIDSLRRTIHDTAYQIIVINHQSDEVATLEYFEQLKADADCRVIDYSGNFNFSKINNFAIRHLDAGFSHYLLCNNDIEALEDGWLERMLALGQLSDVGAVGAQLYYPGGELIQHAGVCVGLFGAAEHYGKLMNRRLSDGRLHPGLMGSLIANHEMSAVTAACVLLRRDVWEEVSGFDENIAVGFGDVDLCLRIREAGYRILFCPEARLIHHESISRGKSKGKDPHPEDSAYFRKRWIQFLTDGDPYYSPNLNLNNTHWGISHQFVWTPQCRRRVYNSDDGTITTRIS